MEGIGTAKVTDNAYKYNGKELNEDLGLNLSDYGARWYDAAVGRWWSVDPLGGKYKKWSGYNYTLDNPLRFIDPDGRSVTTDFYNQNGTRLGTDGNDNGRIVVVTNKKEAKSISKADKKGGTTQESDIKSGVVLPSAKIREGMGRAVERAGSPSNHEEGGVFGTDYEGNEVVVDAKPGPESTSDKGAGINVFHSADGQPDIKTIEGTFHTHPDGTTETGTRDFGTFGSQSITPYGNEPSDHDVINAKDRAVRGSVKGNSYVLAKGNQTVYMYNGSGTVAKFPLASFVSIGVKK